MATLRRFIDRIDVGSSYVLEICFLTHRAGGHVTQVPVSCEDWRASKFNLLHEAFYKYRHLLRLWLRSWARLVASRARAVRRALRVALEVDLLVHHVQRPPLDLVVHPAQVLTDHAEREELDAAEEQDRHHG